jgi:hypothetical protein
LSITRLIFVLTLLIAVPTTAYSEDYSSWMSDIWPKIEDKPLNRMVIPGSHDAGTYELSGGSVVTWPYHPGLAAVEYLGRSIVEGYSEAQSVDVGKQLHAGARWFDLRFVEINPSGNTYYYQIHHTLLGPTAEEIFDDIEDFLEQDTDKREIIILRFNTIKAEDGHSCAGREDELCGAGDRRLLKKIFSRFAKYMAEEPSQKFSITPEELLYEKTDDVDLNGEAIFGEHTGRQLIVLYGAGTYDDQKGYETGKGYSKSFNGLDPATNAFITHCPLSGAGDRQCEKLVWESLNTHRYFSGGYPIPPDYDSQDLLENKFLRKVFKPNGEEEENFGTSTSIAMGIDTYGVMGLNYWANPLATLGFKDLEDAAAFTNPRLVPHLVGLSKKDVNLVGADFIQDSGLVEEAIKLNQDPARVSIRIVSIRKNLNVSDCGPQWDNENCDFYPEFTVGYDGAEPVSTLVQTIRDAPFSHPISDKNYVYRSRDFNTPRWTFTTAVPWDSTGLYMDVDIWDDDFPDPIDGDDHLMSFRLDFNDGFLAALKISERKCEYAKTPLKDGTINYNYHTIDDQDYEIQVLNKLGGLYFKVKYEWVIGPWDNAQDGTCQSGWDVPEDMDVPTAPGLTTAVVTYNATYNNVVAQCLAASGSSFSLGMTKVECSDTESGEKTSFTVTVIDEEPPLVVPPADFTVEANGLNSSVDIGQASATDNVKVASISNDAPATYPLGQTVVTWIATDSFGNVSQPQTQRVNVVDTTPPRIWNLSTTSMILWPPNKKMRPVSVITEVSDVVDDSPVCELIDVQVNQTAAPGENRAPLYEITGPDSVLLRADRNGAAGDRLYSLHVSCADFSGNVSNDTTDVIVPHDRRGFGRVNVPKN